MKRDTEKKITIEDLIRLKKAERPPVEFWATFEAEIRSKQLSAIVNKRPWWHGLSRAAMVFNRHQLPFGAAAALAITWAGVHYYSSSPAKIVSMAPARAPEARVSTPAPVSLAPVDAPAPVAQTRVQARSEVQASALAPVALSEPVVTASASHLTKAPAEITLDAISKSPFADGIAVSLTDYRDPAADLSRQGVFGSDRDFETTVVPARQAASDPLARMDPAEERRQRLLAPALPAYSSGARRALAIDWMKARSSSDERMYESMDHGSNDRMLVGFRF
jgi:hypothetical protein